MSLLKNVPIDLVDAELLVTFNLLGKKKVISMKRKKRSVIKRGMPVYKYISGGGEYYSSHCFLSSFKK